MLRLAVLIASGMCVLAQPALAQGAPSAAVAPSDIGLDAMQQAEFRVRILADGLSANLDCEGVGTMDAMRERLEKSTASSGDLGAALSRLADPAGGCPGVQAAATRLQYDLASRASQAAERAVSALETPRTDSAKLVADAMAEADARAASLRFETRPPPPRLTRNRTSGGETATR